MSPPSTSVYEVEVQGPSRRAPPSWNVGAAVVGGRGASGTGSDGVTVATGLLGVSWVSACMVKRGFSRVVEIN